MADILQKVFLNVFSWINSIEFDWYLTGVYICASDGLALSTLGPMYMRERPWSVKFCVEAWLPFKLWVDWVLSAQCNGLSNHCPLIGVQVILQVYFSNSFYKSIYWTVPLKLALGECHKTPLMINYQFAQVMAWCHQATSRYLSQCWPSSMLPYVITRY